MSYRVNIKRDVVMKLLTELDPNGSENQKAHRLRRRQYVSAGPNFCWHADGYEKLKPYGLFMQGCVDGFSRKMLWLKVSRTNNDPILPAYFYTETVKKMGFLPQYLGTDCGTENGIIAGIQCFYQTSEDAQRYGTSVSNQRIGNWWSHMRKGFTNRLIECFKDLVNENICIPGNQTHLECSWFFFSSFL